MNVLLWALQILLAAAFLAHGLMFLFPSPELAVLMDASLWRPFRYFLGVAEVAAGIGLIVPGVTRIAPWLVPLAAAGLVPIMIGATVTHVARGEYQSSVTTTVLLAMILVVAWGRWRVRPIRG
ncbi:DoxX family protein [Luteitalea sp. TBR-22]|uniref:DoxX family protein n=1 Tax=Luteitalea sp. TBR-22 TaxID=2802971 RepID=UPI001EF67F5E|nr:DoxX family protein [Luteitalea sp. TBR-22]